MTKLEELIKELCPNGVERVLLEKCCEILDNRRKPITRSARTLGEYPYYGANGIQDYVNDYIFDGEFVLVGEDGSVIDNNGHPIVTWASGKIWVNNHAHIIQAKKGVSLRYLFHYIQTIDITSLVHGNIPKLTGGDFRNLQIPLPPLAVQCEIVRILDDFTLLSSELAAELAARRKQYEHYRDKLLSFDKLSDGGGYELRWFKLKEIAMVKTGTKPVEIFSKGKYEYINAGTGNSGYVNSYNMLGDVVTTPSRGQGGIGYVGYHRNAFWLGPLCYSIQSQDSTIVSNKFLYYILVKQRNDILVAKKEGGIPALNAKDLLAIKLPVPPLGVQEKIVETLDKFDKLCNDLSEGLPAEIEARQKQYEYYRDKLLTFQTE